MNLYLIDATYELFRSFYGYPKRLTEDGREVGAVRGLMEHIVRVKNNEENKFLAKKQGYNFTKRQLKKWGVNYNKLIFGKPSYDVYVDDKNLGFKKNWPSTLFKKIKKDKI